MRVVFMGTPDFAVSVLRRLVEDKWQVAAVYTQPDKPKNRGMKLVPTPVKEYAVTCGIPVYQPESCRDEAVLEELRALEPDVIVVAAYGKLLPQALLDIPKQAIINVHSSILPQYRGAAPINWAVLNGDDVLLNTLQPKCDTVRCGRSETCAVRITELEDLGLEGMRCTVVTDQETYPLTIPAPGVHMALLSALAVAVAERLGLTEEEIVQGVASYAPADNRLRVERLPGGRLMINDSYNANPRSVQADLRILAHHTGGKRIAMLGDMTELGAAEAAGHRDVGRLAGELGIEALLAVGPRSREHMVPAAKAAGCPDVRWFETRDEARDALVEMFAPGDAALLKASHFLNRFDLAADDLRRYPFP